LEQVSIVLEGFDSQILDGNNSICELSNIQEISPLCEEFTDWFKFKFVD